MATIQPPPAPQKTGNRDIDLYLERLYKWAYLFWFYQTGSGQNALTLEDLAVAPQFDESGLMGPQFDALQIAPIHPTTDQSLAERISALEILPAPFSIQSEQGQGVWPPAMLDDLSIYKRGEMYNFNTATAVVIAGANQWTEVGGGFSAGMLNGVTFQNAKELKIVTAGVYAMWWSMSLNALGANDNIEGGIFVNGAIAEHTVSHNHLATANDNATFGSHGFHTLAVDDLVSLAVNNNTDADDIVVEHGNLLIARWPQ